MFWNIFYGPYKMEGGTVARWLALLLALLPHANEPSILCLANEQGTGTTTGVGIPGAIPFGSPGLLAPGAQMG